MEFIQIGALYTRNLNINTNARIYDGTHMRSLTDVALTFAHNVIDKCAPRVDILFCLVLLFVIDLMFFYMFPSP